MNSLKEKFISSLENDYDHWVLVQKGPRGFDWVEYWSPRYDDLIFMVNHRCHIFKEGEVIEEFPLWPFTKCARLVSRMQKHTLEKTGCFRSELMPT